MVAELALEEMLTALSVFLFSVPRGRGVNDPG
jgi:hypothetical protein